MTFNAMATSYIEPEVNNNCYSEINSNVMTEIFLVIFYFVVSVLTPVILRTTLTTECI
jgi:hypothetical protein